MPTRKISTQRAGEFATLLLAVSLQPDEIGDRIAEARDAKGWTQLDFAYELGVSPSTVQRWEAGKLPKVKRLMQIAEKLDLPVSALVEPPASESEVVARLDRIERVLEVLVARSEPGEQPP